MRPLPRLPLRLHELLLTRASCSIPIEFFGTDDSFSPAIHNVQNTLVFRLSNPDADLPPIPPVLTKYMDPPSAVAEAAAAAVDKVKRAFDVQIGASPSSLSFARSLLCLELTQIHLQCRPSPRRSTRRRPTTPRPASRRRSSSTASSARARRPTRSAASRRRRRTSLRRQLRCTSRRTSTSTATTTTS